MVGVPGVGKTSLCREAAESTGYIYINYGELMLDFARKEGIASTQEEMFELPLDEQYKLWREAANSIRDMDGVLVDLHGLDRTDQGYLISLPLEILTPQIIILVEATYNSIIKRRINDKFRTRPLKSLKSLKEEIELLRAVVAFCSVHSGSLFELIENDDFAISVDRLKNLLIG